MTNRPHILLPKWAFVPPLLTHPVSNAQHVVRGRTNQRPAPFMLQPTDGDEEARVASLGLPMSMPEARLPLTI
jgi:hypothetical protein